MTTVEKGPWGAGFVNRVRDVLTKPSATFDVIAGETATIGGLYRGWVIPLVLFSVACQAIGSLLLGRGMMGFGVPLTAVLASALIGFALNLALVFVMALIIDALAPTFDGQKSRVQAFKAAAYSGTAAWVAGVFGLVPALGLLTMLAGLYSLYLYYRALPRMMKAPEDKAMGYTVVVVIAAVVLWLCTALAIGATITALETSRMMHRASNEVAEAGVPVDLAELEKSAKAFEDAGKGPEAVDPESLKVFLPEAVAGFTRTEISAGKAGSGGLSGSGVEGRYTRGQSTLRLSLTDVGSAAPLAAMARALNVSSSTESDGRYEKVGEIDGRMTRERFNRDGGHGQYSVLVADRFMIEASGDAVTMADLKAAVNAVDADKLEAMADKG